MQKFLEHRIADRRILRLIQQWLKAGVVEDGSWTEADAGTPQGSGISPLLSNVFLHYVFDLWADQWRRRNARGDVVIVRYADDFVMGFRYEGEARRFLKDLRERFARFGLDLHADKTRLIEFGRFAAKARSQRGKPKPETFDFLGFTHACGANSRGYFEIKRRPIAKRVRAKLQEIKLKLKYAMHNPVIEQGKWLRSVVRGWFWLECGCGRCGIEATRATRNGPGNG
jgi:retron-type reverse transcriptase